MQHAREVRVTAASVVQIDGNSLMTVAFAGEKEPSSIEFHIEHKSQQIQDEGQRVLSELLHEIGLCDAEEASELVGKYISLYCFEKLKRMVAPKKPPMHYKPVSRTKVEAEARSDAESGRYVYVISCKEPARPLCKIGIAGSPEKRLKQLSTSSPFELQLELSRRCEDARSIESAAHNHFSASRMNGEWFNLSHITAINFVNGAINHSEGIAA